MSHLYKILSSIGSNGVVTFRDLLPFSTKMDTIFNQEIGLLRLSSVEITSLATQLVADFVCKNPGCVLVNVSDQILDLASSESSRRRCQVSTSVSKRVDSEILQPLVATSEYGLITDIVCGKLGALQLVYRREEVVFSAVLKNALKNVLASSETTGRFSIVDFIFNWLGLPE
jgi:hypothetical protein